MHLRGSRAPNWLYAELKLPAIGYPAASPLVFLPLAELDSMVRALYQRLQDDEAGDDPLLDDFKGLRRRIFHWHGQAPRRTVLAVCHLAAPSPTYTCF